MIWHHYFRPYLMIARVEAIPLRARFRVRESIDSGPIHPWGRRVCAPINTWRDDQIDGLRRVLLLAVVPWMDHCRRHHHPLPKDFPFRATTIAIPRRYTNTCLRSDRSTIIEHCKFRFERVDSGNTRIYLVNDSKEYCGLVKIARSAPRAKSPAPSRPRVGSTSLRGLACLGTRQQNTRAILPRSVDRRNANCRARVFGPVRTW